MRADPSRRASRRAAKAADGQQTASKSSRRAAKAADGQPKIIYLFSRAIKNVALSIYYMEGERPVIDVQKIDGHVRTYYKCLRPDCNAKTSKDYCRHHVVVLNKCVHPNCGRNCRGDRCRAHTERSIAKARERAARARERQRAAKAEQNVEQK